MCALSSSLPNLRRRRPEQTYKMPRRSLDGSDSDVLIKKPSSSDSVEVIKGEEMSRTLLPFVRSSSFSFALLPISASLSALGLPPTGKKETLLKSVAFILPRLLPSAGSLRSSCEVELTFSLLPHLLHAPSFQAPQEGMAPLHYFGSSRGEGTGRAVGEGTTQADRG